MDNKEILYSFLSGVGGGIVGNFATDLLRSLPFKTNSLKRRFKAEFNWYTFPVTGSYWYARYHKKSFILSILAVSLGIMPSTIQASQTIDSNAHTYKSFVSNRESIHPLIKAMYAGDAALLSSSQSDEEALLKLPLKQKKAISGAVTGTGEMSASSYDLMPVYTIASGHASNAIMSSASEQTTSVSFDVTSVDTGSPIKTREELIEHLNKLYVFDMNESIDTASFNSIVSEEIYNERAET